MKNWNKFGYGKAIFIAFFAVFNFISPIYYGLKSIGLILTATIGAVIGCALFGTLIIYIIVKLFNGEITEANWNDNPIMLRKPTIYLQFVGVAAIFFGLSNLLSVYITYADISIYGLQNIFSGIGFLLSLKFASKIITGTSRVS